MKLSERIRKWRHVSEGWHLAEHEGWADEVGQLEAHCDKLAAGLPDGILPKDVEVLRDANTHFAQRNHELEEKLGRCYKLARSYIGAYEKFAFESGISLLKGENERLTKIIEDLEEELKEYKAEIERRDDALALKESE